jgi:soluble lytic murein transglycosylase-like protein
VREYNVDPYTASEIIDYVYLYSDPTSFPRPATVLAVIATESSFRPSVSSHVGAYGLMQVKERFHGPTPTLEDNIRTGIRVLREYRKRVKSNEDALHAYNVGITAFKSSERNESYVAKVKYNREKFETVLKASEV